MPFNFKCIKDIFNSSGGSDGNLARAVADASKDVDWVALGKKVLEMAGPYIVQFLGEVERPEPVDPEAAAEDAQDAESFKPYDVPPKQEYQQGNVRAVLIGINYYGTSAQLSGCVNDVRQELATFQRTNFPVKEMAILVDEPNFPNVTALPTRANIIKYMAWLVKDSKPGDVLFLHYSGHGTYTKATTDSYEEYDQVICPSDYSSRGCIVDNDMFEILARNLPAGVRLTVLFDCCHSASMMDLPYSFVGSSSLVNSKSYHMKQVRNNNFCAGDVLMISGCQDDQTSADVSNTAAMGNGTSGAGGAATQCLTFTLLNTKNLSYQSALIETREMLAKKKFTQVPQLTASKPLDLQARFSIVNLLTVDKTMARSIPEEFR